MMPYRYVLTAVIAVLLLCTAALVAQPASDGGPMPNRSEASAPVIDTKALAARIHMRVWEARAVLPHGIDIMVMIDSTGEPIRVADSRGHELRSVASAAVKAMKFGPARLGRTPVSAVQWIHLDFAVNESDTVGDVTPIVSVMRYEMYSDGAGHTIKLPDPDEFVPVDEEPKWDAADLLRRLVYPEIARRNGIEGIAVIRVLISSGGVVLALMVDRSDNRIFEQAAIDALVMTHFTPATRGGKTLAIWEQIPVTFKLY